MARVLIGTEEMIMALGKSRRPRYDADLSPLWFERKAQANPDLAS